MDAGERGRRLVLQASGISKSFLGVPALRNVSFALQTGEVHALMGENGAGKSTLMKIFSGVDPDYAGVIHMDGQEVRFASVRDAEAAGVAIIHQELNLVPELNVAENIFLGREPLLAGLIVNRRKAVADARALLDRLGMISMPETRISSLRVGEQQLVEIARALSVSARILIMDEPTSALSPAECRRLFTIIRQLASAGVAIIYISHRIEEVMLLADRVTVLRDGCHVVTKPRAALTQETIIAAMVGRESLGSTREQPNAAGRVVLSVRDLSLDVSTRRGWRSVLNGVSFDVHEGEIFGIAGLLGSGRTEILETIFGSSSRTARWRDPTRRRGRFDRFPPRCAPPRPGFGHRGPQGKGTAPLRVRPRQCRTPLAVEHRAVRSALLSREARLAERAVKALRDPLHRDRPNCRNALRRQPAEGGDREMARHAAARSSSR